MKKFLMVTLIAVLLISYSGVTFAFNLKEYWNEAQSKTELYLCREKIVYECKNNNENTYYLDAVNSLVGLQKIGDYVYYFDEKGEMIFSDSVTVDGYIYTFGEDGKMVSKTAVSTAAKEAETEITSTEKESSLKQTTSTEITKSAEETSSNTENKSTTTTKSSKTTSTSTEKSTSETSSKNTSTTKLATETTSSNTYSYKAQVGTLSLLGYSANLYTSTGSSSKWQQIVDDSNSAMAQAYKGIILADHNTDGLTVMTNCKTGSKATVTLLNGETLILICKKIYRHVPVSDYVSELNYGEVMIYTCEVGTTSQNVVTFWSPSDTSLYDEFYKCTYNTYYGE